VKIKILSKMREFGEGGGTSGFTQMELPCQRRKAVRQDDSAGIEFVVPIRYIAL
jgi:hypothetical protein